MDGFATVNAADWLGPPGVSGPPVAGVLVTTKSVLSPVVADPEPEPVDVQYANAAPPPPRTSAAATAKTAIFLFLALCSDMAPPKGPA